MQEPSFSVSTFTSTPTSSDNPVTCAATSSKFVVLGLSDGSISLYDVFGNRLDQHKSLHNAAVTVVALGGGPAADSVVASAGANGQIRVARLFVGSNASHAAPPAMLSSANVAFVKNVDATVLALAIDPSFGKPRFGDRIAYADSTGRIIIYTSGWFGGNDVVISPASAHPVFSLAWVHNLLAFPVQDGVHVYDTRLSRLVCRVAAPGISQPASPISDHSPPSTNRALRRSSSLRSSTTYQSQASSSTSQESDNSLPNPRSNTAQVSEITFGSSETKWALHTRIYMDVDDTIPRSDHGEPAIRLFLTWPAGARIIRVGPHNHFPAKENTPAREIDVIFKLERQTLLQNEASLSANSSYPTVEGSPVLSTVPFGREECVALLGLPTRGLALHLISADGRDVKNMILPHRALRDASVLTVPGGDPLVLVLAHLDDTNASPLQSLDMLTPHAADVLYVRPLSIAERVKWLLGQNRFQDALNVAQSAPGGSLRRAEVSLLDIGEQFLESLKDAGDYKRLATVLPETIETTTPFTGVRARDKVMTTRKRRWEHWVKSFREANQLGNVASVVPTYEPLLDEKTYTNILVDLSATYPAVMLRVLKTWPTDVFDVSTVTKAIEEQLTTDNNKPVIRWSRTERESLNEGLLMMYGLSGRHDETLIFLLRDKSPKVFDYIKSHHLYEAVRSVETVSGLYEIDPEAATDILSHAPETVLPPDAVVPILTKVDNSLWTFMYLHALFRIDVDQAPKYHSQLLKLYVKHGAPGALYHFLRTSTHYSLDVALQAMGGPKGTKEKHLARERVYVLSAMGDLNSAMDILLNELGETFSAIEFATDHGDPVLWERLIEYAKNHADTLAALMDSPAGGKVDPVRLVPLLKSEMRIPNLRDRLHRILVDAALERALREDATAALHHDASQLLQSLDECVSGLSS